MSRTRYAAVLAMGCVVSLGQSTPGANVPSAPVAEGATDAAPTTFDRIRDLIVAGDHLEAAGEHDLARLARQQANRLLEEEGVRLAQEQEQLERLSHELNPTQISISALIVETKHLPGDILPRMIGQLGGEPVYSDTAGDAEVPCAAIFPDRVTYEYLVQSLKLDDVRLDVLSNPHVLTLDGQEGQIQIGQSVPVVNGFTIPESGPAVPTHATDFTGISLTLTPTTVPEGRIRLDLAVEQTRFSDDGVPLYANPTSGDVISSPVKDIKTTQTTFTVPEGRTLLFPVDGPPEGEVHDAEPALLLILNPRVVPSER